MGLFYNDNTHGPRNPHGAGFFSQQVSDLNFKSERLATDHEQDQSSRSRLYISGSRLRQTHHQTSALRELQRRSTTNSVFWFTRHYSFTCLCTSWTYLRSLPTFRHDPHYMCQLTVTLSYHEQVVGLVTEPFLCCSTQWNRLPTDRKQLRSAFTGWAS